MHHAATPDNAANTPSKLSGSDNTDYGHHRPTDLWPVRVLALDLGGLAVAYLLTRLVALPPLDPEQEPFDAIGLLTLAAEGAGIVAALRLYRRPSIATGRALAALTQGGSQ